VSYAEKTTVSVGKTRGELLELLEKHGCGSIGFTTSPTGAAVTFQAHDRWIRFRLVFAGRSSFVKTPAGQARSSAQIDAAQDQHARARWRQLLLVVKAKLEAVDEGIEEFDEAFLAHVVLPDDRTVFEASAPVIEASYRDGNVRPLLGLEP
jgi:hypothetical protein